MARRPEPRWYASRGGWYACIDGRQHRLAAGKDSKEEAWKAFHRLQLEGAGPTKGERTSVATLCDLLLDWVQVNREPLTYEFYKQRLQKFVDSYGKMKADEITPGHVSRWLARSGWGPSTKYGAVTAIKRVYRWGNRNGFLDVNPIEWIEKPAMQSRGQILTGDQVEQIMAVCDGPFLDLVVIMHETGMRPSETYRLEAKHCDFERCLATFAKHKSIRTSQRPRVVYLTPRAVEILKRLSALHPQGPLLRNTKGTPWTRHAVAHRFERLRGPLGMGGEATAESFRHLFVTDALDVGVPIATVAQLTGHASTSMVERFYSHLSERGKHLHRAVSQIRGRGSSGDPDPSQHQGADPKDLDAP